MKDENELQEERIHKGQLAQSFEISDEGKLIINLFNGEIARLTKKLAEDDELDKDNVARANVRGQLKAFRFMGEKLNQLKITGAQAQRKMDEREPESPEEIAKRAGL